MGEKESESTGAELSGVDHSCGPAHGGATVLLPLGLAAMAMYGVYQGIHQVLLPAQVESMNPVTKVTDLAALAVVSSVAGTLALPLGGAVSDRTRSRFGRRTPWLAAMALLSGVLCFLMGSATNLAWLAIICGALWFSLNWYQAVIYAVIPDRLPPRLRGLASSVVGLALPLGILVAVNVVSRTTRETGYLFLAATLVATTGVFLFRAREQEPRAHDRGTLTNKTTSGRSQLKVLLGSFRDLDFTLVFLSRCAFYFGYFAVGAFLFYILTDHIRMENVPISAPAVAVSVIASVATVSKIVAIALVGWVADRLDQRRLVVSLSAVGMAVSFVIPLVQPTWLGMLAYAVLNGASTGVFFAADLALMTLVLPSRGDEGRDLGLLAIATSLPSAFGPAIAALLLSITHTYSSVFCFGAIMAGLGGAIVLGVRKVR